MVHFLNLAAGNYNVSVTDAELKTVNWPTVINITAPLDDIAITATGSTSICVGNSVKLDASGGYGNYTWSPSAGLNTTSGGSVIASPNATRTYTLTSDNGVSGSELIVNGGFESGSTLTGFTTQYTSASAMLFHVNCTLVVVNVPHERPKSGVGLIVTVATLVTFAHGADPIMV